MTIQDDTPYFVTHLSTLAKPMLALQVHLPLANACFTSTLAKQMLTS